MLVPLAVCALLAAPRLFAATFLVPDDRALVRASKAVVIAEAGESHSRWSAGGWIETVTKMRVEESIRGPLHDGQSFEVTELGGSIGDRFSVVPGSPTYASGERVLLFLETTDRGAWCAKNMVVGKFDFARDVRGRQLLLREPGELAGEPQRLAPEFLDYVRAVARGEEPSIDYVIAEHDRSAVIEGATTLASPPIGSYLQAYPPFGARWPSFPVSFSSQGSQPGATNGGLTALQRGLGAWTNDSSSSVVLQYSSGATNIVKFNDPAGEIPGSFNAVNGATLAVTTLTGSNSTHTFSGETFVTITAAELVVQDGITGAGLTANGFDHVLTHELGHAIGFRHSDQPPPGGTSSSDSVMFSSVNFNNDPTGSTLLSWDKEALAAVYPAGSTQPVQPPPCTPPSILSQPKSTSTINTPVTLTVIAAPLPLQYQWYTGAKGSTSSPIGGAQGGEITILPSVTTSYWVRVSNGCAPAADSDAAIVTVNGCPIVMIDSQSTSTSIIEGKSATLTVSASGGSGMKLQWYAGSAPDKSTPIPGATSSSLLVTPTTSSSYWLEATNSCGAFARSETITITVVPCIAPTIVVQPSGGMAVSGESITLAAAVNASQPLSLQWYEGNPPDTSRPVANANAATLTAGPIIVPTSFWLHATNDCGEASSAAAAVALAASCIAPAITRQPADVSITPGTAATLSVSATGTSLTYRWYQGPLLDFTHPVGVDGPVLLTGAINAPAQFWVRITNNCGSANSSVATVTPIVSKHRGVSH